MGDARLALRGGSASRESELLRRLGRVRSGHVGASRLTVRAILLDRPLLFLYSDIHRPCYLPLKSIASLLDRCFCANDFYRESRFYRCFN
jgi:hypothetical protein